MIQLSFVAKYCSDAEHTVDAEQCWCWALLWCWAVWALMLDAAWRPHPLPLIPTHPASSYTCTFVNEIFERSVVNIMFYMVFRIFVTSWWPNRVKGYFQFSGRLILCRLPLVHNCTELPCLFLVFLALLLSCVITSTFYIWCCSSLSHMNGKQRSPDENVS